jgi:hypothetical protein
MYCDRVSAFKCRTTLRVHDKQYADAATILENAVSLMTSCLDKTCVAPLVPSVLTLIPLFERALSSSVFLNLLQTCLDCNLIQLAWNVAVNYRSGMVYSLAFLQTVVKRFPAFDALHISSMTPKDTLEFLRGKLLFTFELLLRSIEQDMSFVAQTHLDLLETLSDEILARMPAPSSDKDLIAAWSKLRQVCIRY